MANVYSELPHSNTNLTQLSENQLKQPICVCGTATVGPKFPKIRSHVKKKKWHYQHFFSCFAEENTFQNKRWSLEIHLSAKLVKIMSQHKKYHI